MLRWIYNSIFSFFHNVSFLFWSQICALLIENAININVIIVCTTRLWAYTKLMLAIFLFDHVLINERLLRVFWNKVDLGWLFKPNCKSFCLADLRKRLMLCLELWINLKIEAVSIVFLDFFGLIWGCEDNIEILSHLKRRLLIPYINYKA